MQAIRTLRGAAHARAVSPAQDQFVEEPASQHKSISTNNTSNTNANSSSSNSTALSRIQTLAKLRRLSPPTTPAPQPTPPPTLVQDGSYLQTLGLKLNGAISRALAPVLGGGTDSLKGRRPLPSARGRALGALISRYVSGSSSHSIVAFDCRFRTTPLRHVPSVRHGTPQYAWCPFRVVPYMNNRVDQSMARIEN